MWSEALKGRLNFHQVSNLSTIGRNDNFQKPPDVDIDIYFAKGDHGDKEFGCDSFLNIKAFDGVGGMVAHSEYPPKGVMHLDADEKWSFNDSIGIDLRYTLIHEIGHLLGLRHSRKSTSVMNKYYRKFPIGTRYLPYVDVYSIRRLYGVTMN
ncbi:Matrixin [Dictyocaulus viviparus]|uniref:Matrixin n=1 Tax=Dictyocaulus viviparus TaxID=29172 RepID=A0A0D8Y6U7_DICVI|nr:Matrixin [Dictyocaulus viviparus]